MALSACGIRNQAQATETQHSYAHGDTVSALGNSLLIVYQATDGSYWFGGDDLYHVTGKTIVRFSTADGLADKRIRSIQEDAQGTIYIGTDGGINKFDGRAFTTLMPIKSPLPDGGWRLQAGDLWFSTAGQPNAIGLYRYDGRQLYQLEFPKNPRAAAYYAQYPNTPLIPYDVYYIYRDRRGAMWFGTANLGACRYDGHSFSWLYEDHLTNTPSGGSFGIRSILEDTHGKFWLCNTRYRFHISPESVNAAGTDTIPYTHERGITDIRLPDGSDHVYCLGFVEDKAGDLWGVTYEQGVWRYDGKKTTHYAVKNGKEDAKLFTIYQDRQGKLWLGSHETGVYFFNGKSFERFMP